MDAKTLCLILLCTAAAVTGEYLRSTFCTFGDTCFALVKDLRACKGGNSNEWGKNGVTISPLD